MSDIQFLINLIINYNLTEDAKKLCLERIGEIEKRAPITYPPIHQSYQPPQYPGPSPVAQAQIPMSAAQLRDMQSSQDPVAPPAQLLKLQAQGEVITGGTSGTSIRGPNKMRGRL